MLPYSTSGNFLFSRLFCPVWTLKATDNHSHSYNHCHSHSHSHKCSHSQLSAKALGHLLGPGRGGQFLQPPQLQGPPPPQKPKGLPAPLSKLHLPCDEKWWTILWTFRIEYWFLSKNPVHMLLTGLHCWLSNGGPSAHEWFLAQVLCLTLNNVCCFNAKEHLVRIPATATAVWLSRRCTLWLARKPECVPHLHFQLLKPLLTKRNKNSSF